ncbi:glycosyltransferase family 87 protein [Microvirga aerilata]|nr:glycosyltransferase family 87 protein [Microvirga aerilata]
MMTAATRWIPSLIVAVLAVLAIWAEFPRIAHEGGLWDFGSFVASARAAKEGLNPYGIYELTLHVELPGFESWNPNLNPPISALLFRVFDVADPHMAYRIWRWISIAFYAATVFLLARRFGGVQAMIFALWAFALAGFWDTLFLGQIYLPLVFAGVAAWLLLERGQGLAAGILIGIIVAMKPNFLVWPALLFLSGYYRPVVAAGLTAGIISAIPLLVYGPEIYRQWFELVASDRERAFFLTNGSFAGLSARAGVPLLGLILSLALLAGLALWAFRLRPNVLAASALALVAALLASPLGWIHYTLFLLPVFLVHWHRPVMRIVALLLIIPVPFVIDQFTKATWIQLTIGSVYGWALVLCLAMLMMDEWQRMKEGGLSRQTRAALPEKSYSGSAS